MRATRLLLMLALLAPPLAAQDARLTARLAPGPRAAVQALIDSATRSGLPAEPLVQKALEGVSKGADSGRIVAAVRLLAGHLGTARQALPNADQAELVAAAAALRGGAAPSHLTALGRLVQHGSLTVPLSVLADLLSAGIPGEQAWNSVRELASRGAPESAFLALQARLAGGAPGAGTATLPPPVERTPAPPVPERSP
jgi:hypothetical protein